MTVSCDELIDHTAYWLMMERRRAGDKKYARA